MSAPRRCAASLINVTSRIIPLYSYKHTDRTTYAVGVRARQSRPRIILFLAGLVHECGQDQPKRKDLGGPAALQTSHVGGDRASHVRSQHYIGAPTPQSHPRSAAVSECPVRAESCARA